MPPSPEFKTRPSDPPKIPSRRKDDTVETMGNKVIIIPTIKDGPTALGDMWDCRSSSVVGNIFAKPLGIEHLEAHPISLLKYNLQRVQNARDFVAEMFVSVELSLECSGGSVKVKGAASFETKERQKFHQERLLCNYDLTTYEVRLLPRATTVTGNKDRDVMSYRVKELLENGSLVATHYVQSITLGGRAQASITYYENIDKSHMNLTGSFDGTIKTGGMTATARASLELLDSEFSESHRTEISVTAQPRIKSAPTSVEDMFLEVERIDKVIENEKHFPQLTYTDPDDAEIKREIIGIPLRFRLVPINRIVTLSGENDTYKQLKEEILNEFADMMLTLDDYSFQDYLKQLLRKEVPSIIPILQDDAHPLTREIDELAITVMTDAMALKKDAILLFSDFKYGLVTEVELSDFLLRYSKEFLIHLIVAKVSDIGLRGRMELATIRSADVVHLVDATGKPCVNFFTNKASLDEWYLEERSIKLLLKSGPTATGSPNGLFQSLYQMSGPLKKIGVQVGIAFPSISSDFSLTLKMPLTEVILTSNDEITFATDLFRMATETGGGEVFSKFFSINSELSSLQIPLRGAILEEFPTFMTIMRTYLPVGGNTLICETYCHLLASLSSTLDTFNFVFPLEAIHRGVEMMAKYRKFRRLVEETGVKHRWIFSKFNVLGKYSAPLLFVFKDDVLTSICYDSLDVATLIHCLKEKEGFNWEPISIGEGRKSSLYVEQWNYSTEIVPNCILEQSTHFSEPLKHHESFPPNDDPTLAQALDVLRPLALHKDREVIICIARFALKGSFYLELEQILVKHMSWADNEISKPNFADIDWPGLSTDAMTLMQTGAPHLVMTFSVLERLKKLMEPKPEEPKNPEEPENPEQPENPEEPENPEDPENPHNPVMHEQIDALLDFLTRDHEEGDALTWLRDAADKISKDIYTEWFDRKEKLVLVFKEFLLNESAGAEYFHLLQLSQVANQMSIEGSISANPVPLARSCCDMVTILDDLYPNIGEKLENYLDQGQLFHILRALDSITVNASLHQLHKELAIVESLPAPLQTKSVLEKMMHFDQEQVELIWTNPKFLHLVRTSLSNSGVVDTLYALIAPHSESDGDGGFRIPFYVPNDVAEKIKPLFGRSISSSPSFPWETEWNGDVDKFSAQLAIFMAKLAIPDSFQSVFQENLITSSGSNFEDTLLQKKVLFYWDKDRKIFTHNWTLLTVKIALARLTEVIPLNVELSLSPPNTVRQNTISYSKHVIDTDYLEVIDRWRPFVNNAQLPLTSGQSFTAISKVDLAPPKISYVNLNQTSTIILPYILDHLKSTNTTMTTPAFLSNLIDYPTPGFYPGQINFGSGIPEKSNGLLFTRDDLFTAILQTIDPLVVHQIYQILSDAGHTLPLLIPDISRPEEGQTEDNRWIWMHPVLKDILAPRNITGELPSITRNQFFSFPYRFVLTLRVEDSAPLPGRSSLINRYLLKQGHHFSSLADAGSKFGIPLSRASTLEFIPLTEQTCEPRFLTQVQERSHFSSEPVLLGVLHGNAIRVLNKELFDHLHPHISSVVVFWNVVNWKALKEKKKMLSQIIGSNLSANVLDVVLYPDQTIVDNIRDENLLHKIPFASINPGLIDAINAVKLKKIMGEAIEFMVPEIPETVRKDSSIVVKDAEPLRTEESAAFLQLIEEHSIRKVKRVMLKNEPDDDLKIKIIEAFLAILYLPRVPREIGLHHVIFKLDHLSETASWQIRQKIEELRHQIVHDSSVNKPQLRAQVKVHLEKLDETILTLSNLFYSTGLHILATNSNPDKFCKSLSDCILSSFPMQIEDIFDPEFAPLFKSAMALIPENIRTFTISALGLKNSGKSTLLNRLFGGRGFTEWSSTIGIVLKFIPLKDNQLRTELDCDAFIVLDGEGVGDPENEGEIGGQNLERKLATMLLSCSDLTLINVKDDEIGGLSDIMESALVSILNRVGNGPAPIQKPDVQVIQQLNKLVTQDENIVPEFIQSLSSTIGHLSLKYLLELGILSSESTRLVQVHSKSFQNNLLTTIARLDESNASYYKSITELRCQIQEKCIQSRNNNPGRVTLHEWVTNSGQIWNSYTLKEMETVTLSAEDAAFQVGTFNGIMDVNFAISKAFAAHETRLMSNFIKGIDEIFIDEEYVPGSDAKLDIVLFTVAKDLLQAINTCEKPADDAKKKRRNPLRVRSGAINPNSCDECRTAFTLREDLFRDILEDTKSFLIVEAVTRHTDMARFKTYKKFEQTIFARMILQKKSERFGRVVKELINRFPSEPEFVFDHFIQHLSTLQFIPRGKEMFHTEVDLVYRALKDQIVKHHVPIIDLLEEPVLPDLENVTVFEESRFYSESTVVLPVKGGNMLSWDQAIWLQIKLDELPASISTEFGEQLVRYEFGMVARFYARITEILALLGEKMGGRRSSDFHIEFVWLVHRIGIQLFSGFLDEMETKWRGKNDIVHLMEEQKEEFLQNPDDYFEPNSAPEGKD